LSSSYADAVPDLHEVETLLDHQNSRSNIEVPSEVAAMGQDQLRQYLGPAHDLGSTLSRRPHKVPVLPARVL
jgi:hypothetical protein